jgi:23S rRNA (cytosine1962-C5)-methyltransferase
MHELQLRSGRERSVLRKHPWIFSGSIGKVRGNPGSGETVNVLSHDGQWLARAAYSPHSQIRARIWTWDEAEDVEPSFIHRRLAQALRMRTSLMSDPTVTAYREVHAESDGLPGIIIDRYNEFRVIQFLSVGAERWREEVVAFFVSRGDCRGIYERSDVDVREKEGLPPRAGPLWGDLPEGDLMILEYDLRYYVDVVKGHKTGFYLDQRENRRFAQSFISDGEILNCFAYTGGFTVAALSAGASHALSIDSSSSALELAEENVRLNGLPSESCEWLEGDVFVELRKLRDRRRSFDVVILDPPRFAQTNSQVRRAARGYKDINLLAFKLLKPGGHLITFSCSGAVGTELFQKIVADAALDAEVDATVLAWLGQPPDHPVRLSFPEGKYLKGLVCQVGF